MSSTSITPGILCGVYSQIIIFFRPPSLSAFQCSLFARQLSQFYIKLIISKHNGVNHIKFVHLIVTVYVLLFWNIMQRRLVASNQRAGTVYPPNFKGSRNLSRIFLDSLTLEDGTERLSRNIGKKNYHPRQPNTPAERTPHTHRHGSLRSHNK